MLIMAKKADLTLFLRACHTTTVCSHSDRRDLKMETGKRGIQGYKDTKSETYLAEEEWSKISQGCFGVGYTSTL